MSKKSGHSDCVTSAWRSLLCAKIFANCSCIRKVHPERLHLSGEQNRAGSNFAEAGRREEKERASALWGRHHVRIRNALQILDIENFCKPVCSKTAVSPNFDILWKIVSSTFDLGLEGSRSQKLLKIQLSSWISYYCLNIRNSDHHCFKKFVQGKTNINFFKIISFHILYI